MRPNPFGNPNLRERVEGGRPLNKIPMELDGSLPRGWDMLARPYCKWFHKWRTARLTAANIYQQCLRCGERRANHLPGAFMDFPDDRWLSGRAWSDGYRYVTLSNGRVALLPPANVSSAVESPQNQSAATPPVAGNSPQPQPILSTTRGVEASGFGAALTPPRASDDDAWRQARKHTFYGSLEELRFQLWNLLDVCLASVGLKRINK